MAKGPSNSQLCDFVVISRLGHGSYGTVYKVRRKADNRPYVLKQINISCLSRKEQEEAINEVRVLSQLDNEYVVKYFDSFVDKSSLNIVMELAERGDLHHLLKSLKGKSLPENRIWRYFIQMTAGLHYIHSKNILHRDMKSLNVFLDGKDNVKIGDLGVARVLSTDTNFARTLVGTPYYLSPELCENRPYNAKSDVWALGCILYELCTLRHPFDAQNQGALVLKIVRGSYAPIPTSYSTDLASMVRKCLARDPSSRMDTSQILSLPVVSKKAAELDISLFGRGRGESSADVADLSATQKLISALPKASNVTRPAVKVSRPAPARVAARQRAPSKPTSKPPLPREELNARAAHRRAARVPVSKPVAAAPVSRSRTPSPSPRHSPAASPSASPGVSPRVSPSRRLPVVPGGPAAMRKGERSPAEEDRLKAWKVGGGGAPPIRVRAKGASAASGGKITKASPSLGDAVCPKIRGESGDADGVDPGAAGGNSAAGRQDRRPTFPNVYAVDEGRVQAAHMALFGAGENDKPSGPEKEPRAHKPVMFAMPNVDGLRNLNRPLSAPSSARKLINAPGPTDAMRRLEAEIADVANLPGLGDDSDSEDDAAGPRPDMNAYGPPADHDYQYPETANLSNDESYDAATPPAYDAAERDALLQLVQRMKRESHSPPVAPVERAQRPNVRSEELGAARETLERPVRAKPKYSARKPSRNPYTRASEHVISSNDGGAKTAASSEPRPKQALPSVSDEDRLPAVPLRGAGRDPAIKAEARSVSGQPDGSIAPRDGPSSGRSDASKRSDRVGCSGRVPMRRDPSLPSTDTTTTTGGRIAVHRPEALTEEPDQGVDDYEYSESEVDSLDGDVDNSHRHPEFYQGVGLTAADYSAAAQAADAVHTPQQLFGGFHENTLSGLDPAAERAYEFEETCAPSPFFMQGSDPEPVFWRVVEDDSPKISSPAALPISRIPGQKPISPALAHKRQPTDKPSSPGYSLPSDPRPVPGVFPAADDSEQDLTGCYGGSEDTAEYGGRGRAHSRDGDWQGSYDPDEGNSDEGYCSTEPGGESDLERSGGYWEEIGDRGDYGEASGAEGGGSPRTPAEELVWRKQALVGSIHRLRSEFQRMLPPEGFERAYDFLRATDDVGFDHGATDREGAMLESILRQYAPDPQTANAALPKLCHLLYLETELDNLNRK
eukprot:Rmarinus@m.19417